MADATLKVWGADNPRFFSNIQRWLRCLYYVLLEQKLTIADLECFLYWHTKEKREAIIPKIHHPRIKNDLIDFYSKSKSQFDTDIQTTRNRLQDFIHPHVQRIVGLHKNNIDLQRILDKQEILLGNFQPADDYLIGESNLKVIGALMINEIWEIVRRRKEPIDYYLIIDEFASYITPDISNLLTEANKYGLHLILIHQEPDQVKSIAGPMQNAQTKLIFRQENSPKEARWFTLRRANHETVEVKTPDVHKFEVPERTMQSYINKLTRKHFTIEEVDRILYRPNNESNPQDDELSYEDLLR